MASDADALTALTVATSGTVRTAAYQGAAGAYSAGAVERLVPGAEARGHQTFADVFDALGSGAADVAVVPVENSTAGIVVEVNDLLWERRDVSIVAEQVLAVHHALIGPREPIHRAISHPQALAQCARWLRERGIEAVPFYDTAGAVRHLRESPEEGTAAIASETTAELYGLPVLERGIEDDHTNSTRYVMLTRGAARTDVPSDGRRWKLSLGFVLAHQPGALVDLLGCVNERGTNITRLASLPLFGRPLQYRFFVDVELSGGDDVDGLITDLAAHADALLLFGVYPADPRLQGE